MTAIGSLLHTGMITSVKQLEPASTLVAIPVPTAALRLQWWEAEGRWFSDFIEEWVRYIFPLRRERSITSIIRSRVPFLWAAELVELLPIRSLGPPSGRMANFIFTPSALI